ncbi:uncharacterized protein N7459_008111 [Penicillium hispanicum]|uniref:uncharacterized protein n=1 Tax=Penicillium hispanicum TaxID=1080232 RepID=UPI0025410557|nr:uncharacterized protein N7459_008111 [Penicillium hispanicum]KAJ5573684.1 hypothetical protein N7459_008111 [Penicillium hispanicum]
MQIHLDCPNRGYLPGALVQGEIELAEFDEEEWGTLSIVFSGRSMIELKASTVSPGDYGTSTQFLIRSRQVLYEGRRPFSSMPPGGWPFLFTFPSRPHNGMKQEIWLDANQKDWSTVQANKVLPRSFTFSGGPIFSAAVVYQLEARWVSLTHHEKEWMTLSLDTYRHEEDPKMLCITEGRRFSLRSSLIPREETQTRPLTLKDRFHMAFGPDGMTTRAEFKLHSIIGTRIVHGAIPLVELKLEYVPGKSTAADIPAVQLKSATVDVEQVTSVRTLRREVSHTSLVSLGSKYSMDTPLPESEAVDISNILGLRTENIPYDLYTFNIRQRHNLILCFTVECMGKRFEFQQKAQLSVLSPFYEETPPAIIDRWPV